MPGEKMLKKLPKGLQRIFQMSSNGPKGSSNGAEIASEIASEVVPKGKQANIDPVHYLLYFNHIATLWKCPGKKDLVPTPTNDVRNDMFVSRTMWQRSHMTRVVYENTFGIKYTWEYYLSSHSFCIYTHTYCDQLLTTPQFTNKAILQQVHVIPKTWNNALVWNAGPQCSHLCEFLFGPCGI